MKTSNRLHNAIIILTMLLVVACTPQEYENVSDDIIFQDVNGAEFITQDDLLSIGVTLDANYKKEIGYIFITPKPGFSGPEVVLREVLPKGTRLKVNGVFKSTNLINNNYYYSVTFINVDLYEEETTVIKVFGEHTNSNYGLAPELFKLIKHSAK